MRTTTIKFVVAAFVMVNCGAASAKQWLREPKTFLGVAFDRPISESIKTKCPTQGNWTDVKAAEKKGAPCLNQFDRKKGAWEICCFGEVFVRPAAPIVRAVNEQVDGPVGQIVANLEEYEFRKVANLLTQKFGQPHRKGSDGPLMETLIWEGENIKIETPSPDRYADKNGRLRVTSALFEAAEAQKRKQLEMKAKGKL